MAFASGTASTASRFERASGAGRARPQFNSHKTSDRLREGAVFDPRPFVMGGNIRKGRRSVFRETGLLSDDDDDGGGGGTADGGCSPVVRGEGCEANPLYTHDDEGAFGVITGLRSEKRSEGRAEARLRRSLDAQAQPGAGGGAANEQGHRHQQQQQCQEQQQYRHKRHSSTGQARLQRRREHDPNRPWYQKLYKAQGRPQVPAASGAPPAVPALSRFTMLVLLIALVLPAFSYHSSSSRSSSSGGGGGAQGGMAPGGLAEANPIVARRQADAKSPTEACRRFAHQAARINGSLYVYGGQALQEAGQDTGNWNNYLLELDLTKGWTTSEPALKGLAIPEGPPAVSMGCLWNDFDSLYLYGGSFSDSPYVDPDRESIWQYAVADGSWTEWEDPETSKGNVSTEAGQPVRRASEGAGVSVPELGFSYYFGGHQGWATTPGWSRKVPRIYLRSLLEFTHPNWVNDGVEGLAVRGAGAQGAFRNITEGGVQKDDFPERADGVLVYVPGWGRKGVLIGLAGGIQEEDQFTHDLRVLDVYDIANSEWFHQNTTGEAPSVRVNPCAVVAGARDGSSFQVYMFGGQNLQPYKEQIQYDDMYILSIPAFTWIKVDQPRGDHRASKRAGHTCTLRDRQMIVVGGYIGNNDECDSPGLYVFDTTTLAWKDRFEPGDHPADYSLLDSVRAGSYGYRVPEVVQEAIGGGEDGGAKASKPSVPATGGPFATGRAPVITITNAGTTATVTAGGTATGGAGDRDDDDDDDGNSSKDSSGGEDRTEPPHAGLVAAGVVAGLLGALAVYLGFCAWLYRRQVRAYRQHIAVSNRFGASADPDTVALFPGSGGARDDTNDEPLASPSASAPRGRAGRRERSAHSEFAWVGTAADDEPPWLAEPRFTSSEDASPGTLRGSGGAAAGWGGGDKASEGTRARTSEDSGSGSGASLLEGQEPSFFSVVMGPRRALRVVNGVD